MVEEDKHNKIEDIKSHLYNPKDKFLGHHFEGELHKIKYKVPNEWEEETVKKPRISMFKIFFIMAIIFFIGSLGFAFYKFSNDEVSVSSKNIDILVSGNAFTKGGEELPLQIEIVNRNNASLELSNMIISYPSGAENNIADIVRLPRDPLGTIKAGESVIRNIKVKLFGEEKSIRDIIISLEYHPEGSNAIFTKEQKYQVTISSAPLSLFIKGPENITTDQTFSLEVKTVLNTSLPEKGQTVLQMSYPNNFIFESAIPEPDFGNSIWSLSSLSLTNPVSIVINGTLVGQENDEKIFHAYAGVTNPNNQSIVSVVYNSLLHSIIIKKPFLEAKILVNRSDAPFYSASAGESVSAVVSWVNNLSTRITDAKIIVKLGGNILDKSGIDGMDGFYDSANSQIVWDKNMAPELASIEPGGRGSVSFKIKSLPVIGLSNYLKDPQIELDVSIRGRQPTSGSTFNDVNNFSKKIIKILSDFQIATSASYSSGFLPPKVDNETKYIITWTLSNTSNTITGALAKSVLPFYINWEGSLTGGNEKISYNEVSREVTWNIETVQPNTGFSSNREASFMVSLKPSLSQVGSIPQLMKEVRLSGKDTFVGVLIKDMAPPVTIMLLNNPLVKNSNQRIVE